MLSLDVKYWRNHKMIINKDINPERQIYYISSLILKELKNKNSNFFEIYSNLKKKTNLSINLFVFSIDWLFLLGIIKIEKGEILKCS